MISFPYLRSIVYISPESNEIISRLEHDMNNFRDILQKMVEQQLDTKSTLNIAYSFTNSSDFIIALLNCDYCVIELLQALIIIFDKKIPEISREVGLNETTALYFNLISNMNKCLIISELTTTICMAVCSRTLATHYYRVEKLSAADSNAYHYSHIYHPVTCGLNCPGYFLMQQLVTLLVLPCFFTILVIIRVVGKRLYITTISLFVCIGFWLFAYRARLHYYYNMLFLFIFCMVGQGHDNPFVDVCLVVTLFVCQKIFGKIQNIFVRDSVIIMTLRNFVIFIFITFLFACFEAFFVHLVLHIFEWSIPIIPYGIHTDLCFLVTLCVCLTMFFYTLSFGLLLICILLFIYIIMYYFALTSIYNYFYSHMAALYVF